MPDPRFFAATGPISVAQAAALVGADGASSAEGEIAKVASLADDALGDAAVYCADQAACGLLAGRAFGLCLTAPGLAPSIKGSGPVIEIDLPKRAFAMLAARLHRSLEETEPDAAGEQRIASGAEIHPSATIGAGAEVGAGARIGPHCHIGRGVVIGEGARLEANVTATHAVVGRHVSVLAGARIGQAGFGFVESDGGLMRVPQLGRVIIGDGVEIGANTTIDRGALDDTVIGEGTKIDNLVQIGHNVRIGRYCVIAAQAGLSGSCVVGDRVMMGGQVGVADHISIGDGVRLMAQAGVSRNVPSGEIWGGSPARPVDNYLRETAVLARLARKK